MADRCLMKNRAAALEIADDLLIGLFHKHTRIGRHFPCKITIVINRADDIDIFTLANVEVDFAECRRSVDNPRSFLCRNGVLENDAEGSFFGSVSKEIEERNVAAAIERFSGKSLDNLRRIHRL